jgi:inosine triphosphate pyrophosphatase
MKIEYVTGNQGKFREAQTILKHWELEQVDLNVVEIQGTGHDIVMAKAKSAFALLQRPLIVDDVSFYCEALNGLPGPYARHFLDLLDEQGLYELIHKYDNHHAQFVCRIAFVEPGQEPCVFEGVTEGSVVAPRGSLKHGTRSFNTIFQPLGSAKTFGEMTLEELSQFAGRSQALNKLRAYLEKHDS